MRPPPGQRASGVPPPAQQTCGPTPEANAFEFALGTREPFHISPFRIALALNREILEVL
jgi:hypothetical protein